MSVESRNVDIEPISIFYAVLTEHISEFLRVKLERKGIEGFMDCRAVVKLDPRARTDEEKHQMHILAFFSSSSKDISSTGRMKNSNNPILDRIDRGSSIAPTKQLRDEITRICTDGRLYINRDDSATYSIDLDIYRLLGLMFDADYVKEEIVITKYEKVSDINHKFIVVKQPVASKRSGNKDLLSIKADKRFIRR